MSCERIWTRRTFWSSEEGYFDHELVWAAARGEYDQVKRFMVVSMEPQRDQETVQELLDAHSRASQITGTVQWMTEDRVRQSCSTGAMVLYAASLCGWETIVQLLLDDYKVSPSAAVEMDGISRTPLVAAVKRQYGKVVQLLLDHKADVNAPAAGSAGRTALQAAAEGGHEKVVQLFLDHKADVNAPAAAGAGRTALQAAAESGHERVVQQLLYYKADVDAPAADDNGRTALQAAAGAGHEKVVQLLLDRGVDVNAAAGGKSGRTALQAAAEGGHEKVVQLLLDHKADINAPAADDTGRTALQAAAGGGYNKVVKLLLGHGADVNSPAGDKYGRTALQAAAEGGRERVVQLLLRHKADINAPAADHTGRTALLAATGRGHNEVVKLLLGRGADVNSPAGAKSGRTALQAAAEGGHEKVVQLLLDHKADVNAPAAQGAGKLALQAAAEGGHEKVVQLLLDCGADVNAPRKKVDGRTALEAAAEGGHEKVVLLLLSRGANVDAGAGLERGTALHVSTEGRYSRVQALLLLAGADFSLSASTEGQNFLHYACTPDRAQMLPELLKNSSPQIVNARDQSGSSPLHLAVRNALLWCVELLLTKSPNIEIQDTSGNTPLAIALDIRNRSIFNLLLKQGASTDTIPTSKYLKWLDDQRRNNNDHDCMLLSDHPTDGRDITETRWSQEKITSFSHLLKRRSILFQRSNQLKAPESPAYRGTCLGLPGYPDSEPDLPGSVVRCMWATTKESRPDDVLNFAPGIPNNQEIRSLSPTSVIHIGHVCFLWPSQHPLKSAAGSSSSGPLPTFQAEAQKVEISWVMSNKNETMAEGSNRPMRFIQYRGTFSLKLLAIPRHGAEFVTWFLREINSRWVELIGSAKSHLAQRRSSQLQAGGASPMIIGFLLQDSQEWSRLRQIWREHYDKSCDLLRQFEEHDVFRIISTDLDITKTHNATAQGAHTNVINESNRRKNKRGTQTRPPLIECLRDQVKYLREDCGQALSELDKETKELIELEFNLVSIYEARSSLEMAKRSIEMAKISNEMARSMKRLSWITFIFLPLMFVTGLFGMNVNVLSDNPPWQWYFIVAGPFSSCVIIISLLCKYLPITDVMEGVDERLQVPFSGGTSSPTTARTTSDHQQVPTGKEFLNNQGLFFMMSGLRRRPTHVNDLESPPPVGSRTPSVQQ